MTSTNRRADGNVAKRLCAWACLFLLLVLPAGVWADDPFKALALTRPKQPLTAHDFTVPGLTAPSLRLSEFRGKVVLLNFWATWCSPCKMEMPAMERPYQRHKTDGFAVLGISVDKQGAAVVTPFAKTFKLTFPIGLDPRMVVAGSYGFVGLPSTFLISRTGSTLAIAVGAREWNGAAAHAMVGPAGSLVHAVRSGLWSKSQFLAKCLERVSVRGTRSASHSWRELAGD